MSQQTMKVHVIKPGRIQRASWRKQDLTEVFKNFSNSNAILNASLFFFSFNIHNSPLINEPFYK